ncbi:hypothetical protein J4G48_0044455 [Bradyrhizobium barranii subsp. apii]|uniref:hypothetical protein n=1 Tax=Bradyrhizobium barranii TaxID=2992140 RepID=UPI001AA15ED4|nr:hypothetical protein [Bradyrhizobium barranii]UPT96051.1 hypothetical protein J4G48_0044455 [Bradyrhizobium barranii subsp. apii]
MGVDHKTIADWCGEFAASADNSPPASRPHFDIWNFAKSDSVKDWIDRFAANADFLSPPASRHDWCGEKATIVGNSPPASRQHYDIHGAVVDGNAARKGNARNQHRKEGHPSGSGHPPTVTRKVAADLGISDEAVRNRVKNATRLAARKSDATLRVTVGGLDPSDLGLAPFVCVCACAFRPSRPPRRAA